MTNTIRLKITCFLLLFTVLLIKDILDLASCHKDEIWNLRAELRLIWDHFRALVPIGTKSQIWDLTTSSEREGKVMVYNDQGLFKIENVPST